MGEKCGFVNLLIRSSSRYKSRLRAVAFPSTNPLSIFFVVHCCSCCCCSSCCCPCCLIHCCYCSCLSPASPPSFPFFRSPFSPLFPFLLPFSIICCCLLSLTPPPPQLPTLSSPVHPTPLFCLLPFCQSFHFASVIVSESFAPRHPPCSPQSRHVCQRVRPRVACAKIPPVFASESPLSQACLG
jgi:hypothetical protein